MSVRARDFYPPRLFIADRLLISVALVAIYTASVAFYGHVQPWQMSHDLSTSTTLVNGLVIGLLVTFRNAESFRRWNEGRLLWGQLTNDSRNLSLKVRTLLNPAWEESERFGRLLIGFAHALRLHLRGGTSLEKVPGFEAEPERPAHVPMHLAQRLQQLLAEWKNSGRIDGFTAVMMDSHSRGLMDVCGGCERIRNTPVIHSYRALLWFGIVLYMLATPWLLVPDAGFWAVPAMGILAFFLIGIEIAAATAEQPFGTQGDDLDLDGYCRTIEGSVAEIFGLEP